MNAVTEFEDPKPLAKLTKQLEERAAQYRLALPSHIKPEDLQRTVLMAAQQNPKLLQADRKSLMLSCMKAAQDGLLPDGREAALVPFSVRKKDDQGKWISVIEVVYMPMVYGMRKKILQSGEVSSMTVGVVYREDYSQGRFLYDVGLEPPIRYKPDLELPLEKTQDSEIVAAFSLVRFKDGSTSAEVMRRAEIDAVREMSQTGATKDRFGKPRNPSGPWVDHFAEMAKKTVMRRHAKVLPMSGDVFQQLTAPEQEVSILSAVGALDSVDEAPPVALSDARTPSDEPEPAQDPQTGMTEVDEETARALDAEQAVSDEAYDADAPADEQDSTDRIVDDLMKRARRAQVRFDVEKLQSEFVAASPVLSAAQARSVKTALDDARARLAGDA